MPKLFWDSSKDMLTQVDVAVLSSKGYFSDEDMCMQPKALESL